MPITPALRQRLSLEAHKVQTNLSYTVRPYITHKKIPPKCQNNLKIITKKPPNLKQMQKKKQTLKGWGAKLVSNYRSKGREEGFKWK